MQPTQISETMSQEVSQRFAPRVRAGTIREIGLLAAIAARAGGFVAGTAPLNLFTTLGRHRTLFWRWLVFASGLMPGGRLPRVETELVILRVATLCQCAYEWQHHVRLARKAGLGFRAIAHVRKHERSALFSPRARALLRATDELHAQRSLSDSTWLALRAELDDTEVIELCMLVGHYEMLAMTLNTLRVPCDRPRDKRSSHRHGLGGGARR